MSKILLAAEIVFRGLDGCVPQQELDLLQFAAAIMAQLRARPPRVMWRNVLQSSFLAAGSDYAPDNVLGDATTPHLSQSGHGSKDFPLMQPATRTH